MKTKPALREMTEVLLKLKPSDAESGCQCYVHVPDSRESAMLAVAARVAGFQYISAAGPRGIARSIYTGRGERAALVAEEISLSLSELGVQTVMKFQEG